MELWLTCSSSIYGLYRLENFITNQFEIIQLNESACSDFYEPIIISAQPGIGVTHLLQGTCNKFLENRKSAYYTSGQYLFFIFKKLKTEESRQEFFSYLMSFDMIAIDIIQFFNRKSARFTSFLIALINRRSTEKKISYLGCSQPKSDFTKAKKYQKLLQLTRIEIKPVSSLHVFTILKNLTTIEDQIPESLLYLITNYSGSIQQSINCLVSIRFKSKIDEIDLKALSQQELEEKFLLKNIRQLTDQNNNSENGKTMGNFYFGRIGMLHRG